LRQLPSWISVFAAASLNAVGKDDTEKEAVLNAATKELDRSFNKADFKKMKVLNCTLSYLYCSNSLIYFGGPYKRQDSIRCLKAI
jgi:hypothetical protein